MKAYGGVDVYIHVFSTSAPVVGEWSASRPGRFTPRCPMDRMLGGLQSRSGRRGTFLTLQGSQPADGRCTDYATATHTGKMHDMYKGYYGGCMRSHDTVRLDQKEQILSLQSAFCMIHLHFIIQCVFIIICTIPVPSLKGFDPALWYKNTCAGGRTPATHKRR
jgi:hypothetical protein